MTRRKLLVIGLDAAPPALVFDQFRDQLPNLSRMLENGVHGPLRSITPPITIPAWMAMSTGKSPGKLGLYGFRHRKNNDYRDITIPTSFSIKEPTYWEIAGRSGLRANIVGVPPTYPAKPINGNMVSCIITPDDESEGFAHPDGLRAEIRDLVGEYIFDLPFRVEDKEGLLDEMTEMADKRFKVVEHLMKKGDWDITKFVCIGVDRIEHAYWKYFDTEHHLYEPGHKFADSILDYFKFVDEWIGRLLEQTDDDTLVMVVSDHGAKRMKGAFCINEWLIEQGYLVLKEPHPEGDVRSISKLNVDWERTKVWGWGGYYSRIFFNVKGREATGVIEPEELETYRTEFIEKLKAIRGPNGEEWKTFVHRPEDIYPVCNGAPPDLMVFLDDLYWRAAGTIGHGTKYLFENDTGPDDAVHDWDGIFILYNPAFDGEVERRANILDIAPTALTWLGIDVPEDMEGEPIPLKE